MLRMADILQVWWKLCSAQCTSMAPCMRHVLLGIFNPSCCEMNGEYILTLYLLGSIIFWKFAKGFSLCSLEFQDKVLHFNAIWKS